MHRAEHSQKTYDPNNLLNIVRDKMHLKNDAALCRALEIAPPIISKIRHGRVPLSSSMLLRLHEVTNLSIGDLRELMGDRRMKYRASYAETIHRNEASVH